MALALATVILLALGGLQDPAEEVSRLAKESPTSAEYAQALYRLARSEVAAGNLEAAVTHGSLCLNVLKGLGPEQDPARTFILVDVARWLVELGRGKEASERADEAATLLKNLTVAADRKFSLEYRLAELQLELGHRESALASYRRCLDLVPQLTGLTIDDEWTLQLRIASTLHLGGRFADARPHYQRCVELAPETEDPDYASLISLSNLGLLEKDLGNFDRSLVLFSQAAGLARQQKGNEAAGCLSSFGTLYESLARWTEAEKLYREAVELYSAAEPEVRDERSLAATVNNLGIVALAQGKLELAEESFTKALELYGRGGDETIPLALTTALTLARVETELGKKLEATQRLARCLAQIREIWTEPNPDRAYARLLAAGVAERLQDWTQSAEILALAVPDLAATYGERHVLHAEGLAAQARVEWQRGDLDQAVAATEKAVSIVGALIGEVGRGLSDQDAVSLATSMASVSQFVPNLAAQDADRAYAWTLQVRRLGLQVALGAEEIRRKQAADPKIAAANDRLRRAQRELELFTTNPPAGLTPAGRTSKERELSREVDLAEALLRQSLPVDPDRGPRAQKPSHEPGLRTVEFVVYDTLSGGQSSPHYGRFETSPTGQVTFTSIGPTQQLQREINRYLVTLQRGEEDLEAAKALGRKLFGDSPEARLHVIPDGLLYSFPFDALVGSDGKYLVESKNILILDSSSPKSQEDKKTPGELVAFVNPDFGPETPDQRAWKALAETKAEGDAIRQHFPEAKIQEGPGATEEALLQVRSPRILHIATHGFFAPNPSRLPEGSRVGLEGASQPLLRSGLVLAGANASRETLGTTSNGYLTALEMLRLDLAGTELVVLSGCNTGRGDVEVGDGVFGMRRSLQLAGAKQIAMSLFPVLDSSAKKFMDEFYRGLAQGKPTSQAFVEAKRILRANPETAAPIHWSPMILVGLDP